MSPLNDMYKMVRHRIERCVVLDACILDTDSSYLESGSLAEHGLGTE